MDEVIHKVMKRLREHFDGDNILVATRLEEGAEKAYRRAAAHFYFALAASQPERAVQLLREGLRLRDEALKSEGANLPNDIHYDMDSLERLRRDIARMAIPLLTKLEKT